MTRPASLAYHEPRCVFRCALWAVIAVLAVLVLLAGCASVSRETIEVKVPVPVKAMPPAELTVPLATRPPVFVAPADPKATSALTAEGERTLKVLLLELLTRVRAWEAWGAADLDANRPP